MKFPKFENKNRLLKNTLGTMNEIKGILLHSDPGYNIRPIEEALKEIEKKNIDDKGYGYHYVITEKTVYKMAEENKLIKNMPNNINFIGKSLFEGKIDSCMISILVLVTNEDDYTNTENVLIHELQRLLKERKNIYTNDIWRAFDFNEDKYSPFHILDKKYFGAYLDIVRKFVPDPEIGSDQMENESFKAVKSQKEIKAPAYPDIADIVYDSPYKELAESNKQSVGNYISSFYLKYKGKENEFAARHKSWDKGIKTDKTSVKDDTVYTLDLETKNSFQYQLTAFQSPGNCDCSEEFNSLDGEIKTRDTMVEPIYPDLVTPPGESITIADGTTEGSTPSNSNTALTPEEFEKRQKQFSFEDFESVRKVTVGRPVNPDDEFPVDEQIKKLEEHFPKIKIDDIKFRVDDTSHTGDVIGQAMAENNAMIYDIFSDISRRVEQRLVKIENNLSTVMRNLFRMSSRVNINCSYYGGQSVYGKYRCIRCLKDSRIDDGAVVSLDQCLSCTRYEPVIGQVYAILEDGSKNVAGVIDDLQMSYMTLEDYNALTQYDNYWKESQYADLNKNGSKPPTTFKENKWKDTEKEAKSKGFKKEDIEKEDYKNGFSMKWNTSQLETQSPHVNPYSKENKALDKVDISEELDRELFEDTRKDAVEYEELKYDINNYKIDNFSTTKLDSLSDGSFGGGGGAEARSKIVEYAKNAVKLCAEGKAFYSLGKRELHDSNAENGISYWDCSSLVEASYRSAKLNVLGGNTYAQYPKYTSKQGGILIPIKDIDSAMEGDVVCMANLNKKPATSEELQSVAPTSIHHTGIYIGNGEYAHASMHYNGAIGKDIIISKIANSTGAICFARPKALVDKDKESVGSSGSIPNHWKREFHNISDELWKAARYEKSDYDLTKNNMNKYGWKDICIQVSKDKGMDPNLIAALISVESKGDPRDNDKYAGLMQVEGHYGSTTKEGMKDNIIKGIEMYKRKYTLLKQKGWNETNEHVAASAYNSGEGTVTNAAARFKISLSSVKIPELGDALKKEVQISNPGWSSNEKREYGTKVLKAYNFIWNDNMLGLARSTDKSVFIRPVDDARSSKYGPRTHPVSGKPNSFHTGVDYASPQGISIKASCAGEVVFAAVNGGYGNCVKVKHNDKYTTLYAHMSAYSCKVGDKLKQGDTVGKVGTTGNSTGPHLHFEILENGKHIDPEKHVPVGKIQ